MTDYTSLIHRLRAAADVVERKRGEWRKESVYAYEAPIDTVWRCSECGWIDTPTFSFCPNCGADMREAEDG